MKLKRMLLIMIIALFTLVPALQAREKAYGCYEDAMIFGMNVYIACINTYGDEFSGYCHQQEQHAQCFYMAMNCPGQGNEMCIETTAKLPRLPFKAIKDQTRVSTKFADILSLSRNAKGKLTLSSLRLSEMIKAELNTPKLQKVALQDDPGFCIEGWEYLWTETSQSAPNCYVHKRWYYCHSSQLLTSTLEAFCIQ